MENLRKDAELRVLTDRQVSVAWILLPILAIIIALVSVVLAVSIFFAAFLSGLAVAPGAAAPAFGAGIGSLFLIPFLADLLFLYFFYLLIRRRNQHFSRQQRFISDLLLVLREAATKKAVSIDALLGSMESSNRQSQVEETEKSAVLWVVLLLIPFVNIIAFLYILYFLTGDYYKHERREDGMLSDTERAFSSMGVQFIFHRNDSVPHRSFVLYLIITIVTFGIFGLYWEYALIKDPNNHFVNHVNFEGTILQLVTPIGS